MRVTNTPVDTSTAVTSSGAVKTPAQKSAESEHSGPRADSVSLSHLSESLTHTDEARLEKLRAAVASGSYSVSSHAIGSRIVDEHIANSHSKPGQQ